MAVTLRPLVWALLTTLLSAVVVAVFSVIYTGQSNRDNNRQWCELLSTLDLAYSSAPPTTELGRKVATSIRELTESFSCEVDNGRQ